jgi:hypothetical protein
MNALQKVLVVDSGQRAETDLLSTQLAELGLSSVTTSLEAAEAVLAVIDRPSAIFLNLKVGGISAAIRERVAALRGCERASGVPVIEWNADSAGAASVSRALIGGFGPRRPTDPAA